MPFRRCSRNLSSLSRASGSHAGDATERCELHTQIYPFVRFSGSVSVCLHTYIYRCFCVYVCMYVCMYVRMYVCVYVFMYVCMYVCACLHVCIHSYVQTHTHI